MSLEKTGKAADTVPLDYADALAREQAARTWAEESERRARMVADVALALSSPITLDATLEAATEALVDAFPGGEAAIWLHDPGQRRLQMVMSHNYNREARQLLANMGEDSETAMGEAFRRRTAVAFGPDDPTFPRLTRELTARCCPGPVSVAAAPLLVAGRRLGALSIVSNGPPLDAPWLETLQAVAVQVAAAVERATLYGREREIAERLQGALLPSLEHEALLSATGLTIAHCYRSGTEGVTVGGDFYDVWPLRPEDANAAVPSARLALVLGDVSGKGLEAAVQTAALRHAVRAYAHEDAEPARVIARLSNLVLALDLLPHGFATMFFATVDAATGRVDYCSAGHESLLLRDPSGRTHWLNATAPALGLTVNAPIKTAQATLEPGGQLVLYTDGVTEARQPETRRLMGVGGLEELLHEIVSEPEESGSSAAALASRLLGRVEAYAGGHLLDDAALLVVLRPRLAALTTGIAAAMQIG